MLPSLNAKPMRRSPFPSSMLCRNISRTSRKEPLSSSQARLGPGDAGGSRPSCLRSSPFPLQDEIECCRSLPGRCHQRGVVVCAEDAAAAKEPRDLPGKDPAVASNPATAPPSRDPRTRSPGRWRMRTPHVPDVGRLRRLLGEPAHRLVRLNTGNLLGHVGPEAARQAGTGAEIHNQLWPNDLRKTRKEFQPQQRRRSRAVPVVVGCELRKVIAGACEPRAQLLIHAREATAPCGRVTFPERSPRPQSFFGVGRVRRGTSILGVGDSSGGEAGHVLRAERELVCRVAGVRGGSVRCCRRAGVSFEHRVWLGV